MADSASTIDQAIKGTESIRFAGIKLVRPDETTLDVDVAINSIPGPHDGDIGRILVISDASRRLHHEKELIEDRRRLESILSGTDAGTWEWDLNSNALTVNDRWLTLIGHAESDTHQVTIDDWRALVHPEDLGIANARLAGHIAGDTPYYEVEFRMRHSEGHWVWILSRGKIIDRNEQGAPIRFAGTHLDITALKRAQTDRLNEKAKFEALFDGLNDAVFVHPVEPFGYANFLEVNEIACQRYGFTRAELLDRSPADLRDPDALQSLGSSDLLKRLYRDGHLLYETRHHNRDGHSFPVEISTKLFDYNGTRALMSLVRDIGARKRNEAKILQSTAVFDRSNEGIAVTDRERRIISVNAAFERLTGYRKDEVLGRNPRFLQSGRHDKAFYQKLWHDLQSHGTWQGEIWNRRKSGELILEWQTITAVMDEDGTVTNYISIFSDITKAKKSEEEVHYLSWHDPLTDLANRRQFEHDLREALGLPGHAAVFYIDIDRFKTVNESFGHAVGDDMLRELARRMEKVVPEHGNLARFSGDEFVMLTRVDSVEKADDQARSLLEQIDQPITLEGVDVSVTGTIGIAIAPEDGGDGPTLLRHAHSALQESKRLGRNTHTVYRPGTPNFSREKILMESSLRLGLERDEFVVCYQPQVDMRTGAIIGSEALVRWRPPNEPEVSPVDFIAIAEDSGLIVALGEWVLRRACEDSVAHTKSGGKFRRVAVNLSGRQLIEKDIIDTVGTILKETGMPPDSLE
ncbi:MAG: PAS domain S-box protein, partial [Pseudomonadota bacterium]